MGKEIKESNGRNLRYNKRTFITVSAIIPWRGGSQAVVRMPRRPHQQSSVNRVSCLMQWPRLGSYWMLESSSPEGSQTTGGPLGLHTVKPRKAYSVRTQTQLGQKLNIRLLVATILLENLNTNSDFPTPTPRPPGFLRKLWKTLEAE